MGPRDLKKEHASRNGNGSGDPDGSQVDCRQPAFEKAGCLESVDERHILHRAALVLGIPENLVPLMQKDRFLF